MSPNSVVADHFQQVLLELHCFHSAVDPNSTADQLGLAAGSAMPKCVAVGPARIAGRVGCFAAADSGVILAPACPECVALGPGFASTLVAAALRQPA